MAKRDDAHRSDQVVPEVFSLDRVSVMGSVNHAEKTAASDCAEVLVQLIATSKAPSTLECADSSMLKEADAHPPAPIASSDDCLIAPKSLKRACPTVVYRRRKHHLVFQEFAAPSTAKLSEQLRSNFNRRLSLEETSQLGQPITDQVISIRRRIPVEPREKNIDDLCEEPSSPPTQSEKL